MKIKRENEKKKSLENKGTVFRDNAETWEKSAPSHEVIQIETNLKKKTKKILLSEQPSGLLLCKGTLTCTATLSKLSVLPHRVKSLIKEFDDVFPKRPIGLPTFNGIEHRIDLVSGASLPNRPTYITNP